jgi:phosphoglycerate dehydrogenase-like enzyme
MIESQKYTETARESVGTSRDLMITRLTLVARVAKAFGMDVVAYTATSKTTAESKQDRAYREPGTGDPDGVIPSAWYSGLDKASLHRFLNLGIDILVLSLPSTPHTYHLIGEAELEILGRTNHTFLSNVGRGELIDHDALVRILKKTPADGSWLRGVALDVTEPEPLPPDSELWTLPTVTITPHVSGAAVGYPLRAVEILATNIERLKRGEPLVNVVDRTRGY